MHRHHNKAWARKLFPLDKTRQTQNSTLMACGHDTLGSSWFIWRCIKPGLEAQIANWYGAILMQQKYLGPHFKQQKMPQHIHFTPVSKSEHILRTQVARIATSPLRARKGTTNNFLCVPFHYTEEDWHKTYGQEFIYKMCTSRKKMTFVWLKATTSVTIFITLTKYCIENHSQNKASCFNCSSEQQSTNIQKWKTKQYFNLLQSWKRAKAIKTCINM